MQVIFIPGSFENKVLVRLLPIKPAPLNKIIFHNFLNRHNINNNNLKRIIQNLHNLYFGRGFLLPFSPI